MSSFCMHASLCLSLPLNVKRECVCMNGHQTWRPNALCTQGCMQEEQTGSTGLFVQHTPALACIGWITPANYIYPFAAGSAAQMLSPYCCCSASLISGGNNLGSLLTTQKPSLSDCPLVISSPALRRTNHEQCAPKFQQLTV